MQPAAASARTLFMPTYTIVDECLDRLRRAGWSIGETGTATRWMVSGTNGENAIFAEGLTQAEAWWHACEQARSVGMLTPPRRVVRR
jgi:hypothetical protein